jgi:hypothetical protein
LEPCDPDGVGGFDGFGNVMRPLYFFIKRMHPEELYQGVQVVQLDGRRRLQCQLR